MRGQNSLLSMLVLFSLFPLPLALCLQRLRLQTLRKLPLCVCVCVFSYFCFCLSGPLLLALWNLRVRLSLSWTQFYFHLSECSRSPLIPWSLAVSVVGLCSTRLCMSAGAFSQLILGFDCGKAGCIQGQRG